MNILHLSAYDFGGAGKAAYRLHRNMKGCGFKSKMVVQKKQELDSDVMELNVTSPLARLYGTLAKGWLKLVSNQDYYFQDQTRSLLQRKTPFSNLFVFQPDSIIVHWVSNFVSLNDVRRLSLLTGAPVFWYLMDMAPLTGGCHYAWDCTGYFHACGKCPALYSSNPNDVSHCIWKTKWDCATDIDVTIVPASSWLDHQAHHSSLFRIRKIEKILLAVNPEIFRPEIKESARERLKLPLDKKIILFGNQALSLKRKGMSYLLEALQILANRNDVDKGSLLIAIAGDMDQNRAFFDTSFNYINLGFLDSDEMLATAYQAADMFICPSVEDSGPMMINESIMCGTPVVSFAMGVAPDLVHTGVTGYRAELKNSADLAHGIKSILDLDSDGAVKMSWECRNLGLQLCHPEVQVEAFRKLIESKINGIHVRQG